VVTVFSSNGRPLNAKFPKIASGFDTLAGQTVVDGEVVALDAQGRPSFNKLQNIKTQDGSVYFYVFDVLVYLGKDLCGLALSERRRFLETIASNLPIPYRFLRNLMRRQRTSFALHANSSWKV
jgi:bifunctional non-homologous end joining protein LigD